MFDKHAVYTLNVIGVCYLLQVGENVITQGLAKDLEEFYDKTESSADRDKALELLTALKFGQEINRSDHYPVQRPHTAMPTYGKSHVFGGFNGALEGILSNRV